MGSMELKDGDGSDEDPKGRSMIRGPVFSQAMVLLGAFSYISRLLYT
jgi:hypothetical protein